MTQIDLAERLDEYQSFVARLESGQRRIDVVEFLEIAEAIGLDPAKAISALKKIPSPAREKTGLPRMR